LAADLGVAATSTAHDPAWPSLVALWQLAGQALLVRLQALEQLGALTRATGPDLAAYDAAIEEYLGQIRTAWEETRQRWAAAAAPVPADFVTRLVADPADPPATAMFAGFEGRATSADEVRYYLDAELSSFVDIRREDVLHTQALPPAMAPLGGCYVWARREPGLLQALEAAAGRSATVPPVPSAPWNGAPWTAAPANGDHAEAAAPPFAEVSPFPPAADVPAAFPDDEEDIPLPPGWPQVAT
jgi:hypothetical protein